MNLVNMIRSTRKRNDVIKLDLVDGASDSVSGDAAIMYEPPELAIPEIDVVITNTMPNQKSNKSSDLSKSFAKKFIKVGNRVVSKKRRNE